MERWRYIVKKGGLFSELVAIECFCAIKNNKILLVFIYVMKITLNNLDNEVHPQDNNKWWWFIMSDGTLTVVSFMASKHKNCSPGTIKENMVVRVLLVFHSLKPNQMNRTTNDNLMKSVHKCFEIKGTNFVHLTT